MQVAIAMPNLAISLPSNKFDSGRRRLPIVGFGSLSGSRVNGALRQAKYIAPSSFR